MAHHIGGGGQLFLDGRDISTLITSFKYSRTMGNVDNTTMRAPARYKTHANTTLSGTTGFTGQLPDQDAAALTALNAYMNRPNLPHIVMMAPFGAEVGRLVRMGKANRTASTTDTMVEAVLSLSAEFINTAGSVGVMPGVCLFSPNVAGTPGVTTQNEIMSLVFTAVDPNEQLALQAVGTSPTFGFNALTTNTALAAGLQGLAAYAGQTVTVTGTLTLAGGTYSGTLTLTWGGAANVTPLNVLQGALHTLVGTGNTVAIYGSAVTVTPGTSTLATVQAAIRALAGRAGAVVSGSITALGAGNLNATAQNSFVASGAGDTLYNGTYAPTGAVFNGALVYSNGTRFLWYLATGGAFYWLMSSAVGNFNVGNIYITIGGTAVVGTVSTNFQLSVNGGAATGVVPTLVGAGTPGSASLQIQYAPTDTPTAIEAVPVAGYVGTTTAGGASTNVALAILQPGGALTGTNFISSPVNGVALQDASPLSSNPTSNGMLLVLQATSVLSGSTSQWTVSHSPDGVTYTPLLAFDPVTAQAAQFKEVPKGTVIQAYLRCDCVSVSGVVCVAIGAARR